MMSGRLRQAGFTLIELMLVTFLLLALIGLSIPLFKRTFSGLSVKNESFNISKLVNYAQEMSVLGRKAYKITFYPEKGKYQLYEVDAAVKPPAYKKIPGRFGKLFSLPQGVSLKADKKDIFFYPDGHCDSLKLNLLAKGEGYSLTVKRFGNMVEMKEVTLEE